MHILLGLGNPGDKYAGNRHNLGFMVVDALARGGSFSPWREKFASLTCEGTLGGVKLLLMKPQTFYNEAGRAGRAALDFYKLKPEDLSVFHDEIDLAQGRVRIKRGGGASGNNGVRSLIAHVGEEVRRVRLGVGHPGHKDLVMPYVLADFAKADTAWREALIGACVQALPLLFAEGDERYQTEIMRLAPAPKLDPRQRANEEGGA